MRDLTVPVSSWEIEQEHNLLNQKSQHRRRGMIAIQVDDIIRFEEGEMEEDEMIELFQKLVDTGLVWQLQGMYGRTAKALIEAGLVSPREKGSEDEHKIT